MPLEKMTEAMEKVLKENPHIFEKKSKNWYLKRKYFLEENEKFLKLVSKELEDLGEKKIQSQELFYMQKLFLEYPIEPPEKLLQLSWENIKSILDLCEEEKRKFYTEVCYFENIDVETLKELIQKDFYEKTKIILKELKEKEVKKELDLLPKIREILSMVWQ